MMIPELEKMSVKQLKAIKEQTDMEVNLLQDSLTNIRTATTRLDLASTALQDLFVSLEVRRLFYLYILLSSLFAKAFQCICDLIYGHRQKLDVFASKSLGDEREAKEEYKDASEAPSNGKGIVGFDFVDGDDRLDQPADIVSSNMICMLRLNFIAANSFCSHVGITRPNPRYAGHVSTISPLPRSYKEAFNDPNWRNAMFDEYNALIKNKSWTSVPRPEGANIVRCMWLFRHKFLANGTLSRYKAPLVANGSTQVEGVDVDETFSPDSL
ncbi:ribonuclease H-like domain-containing protein [Tanacetum coccineum]